MLFDNSIGRRKEVHKVLAAADAARDARDWATAARIYREVLDLAPQRADIFVQYGHALKESGKLDAAEEAYRRAIALDDEVADFHLQLGHALKLRGLREEAMESYRRANELAPDLAAAALELRALDPDFAPAAQSERRECVAIDLSDLFVDLRHNTAPSGIQRVQIGLAQSLVALRKDADTRVLTFIVDGGDLGAYIALRSEAIPRLFAELSREQVSHPKLLHLMTEELGLGTLYTAGKGDIVVVLGAFWVMANAIERYSAIKRAGSRLVVLIHDLIPITHPEYCVPALTDIFRLFCPNVLRIADLILTVSDYSGRQVAEYLKGRSILVTPPIRTLRLAQNTLMASTTSGAAMSKASKVSRLISNPYVLFVSTIEIRKNHLLLFRIWKQLIAKHGASRVPRLVFVGRQGWRVSDLMVQLEGSRMLDGAVTILHGLSDAELSALYRHALLTAFPSFEEGWGLPVGETTAHGRPCIASNTSSIPEVVGDFALYTDPFNFHESYTLYEKMIFDTDAREALARKIKTSFRPREWIDVARDLKHLIDQHATTYQDGVSALLPVPEIKPGQLTPVGHGDDMAAFVQRGLGEIVYLLFDEGWGAIENFGRWMIRRTASLEFAVPESISPEAMLFLSITTPGWLSDATTLTITANGRCFKAIRPARGQPSRLALRCPVVKNRILARFEVDGEIAVGSDPRPLTYGLRSFGYAGTGDLLARLDLLEQITFESARVEMLEPENDPYGAKVPVGYRT
jgi:glycosyltransferase involved in cell wall biosynthesis